jgi:3-dehydroquinate synthase
MTPDGAPDRPDGLDASFAVPFVHRVRFTRGAFEVGNAALREVVAAGGTLPARTIAFIDEGVAAAWPALARDVERYAAAHAEVIDLARAPQVVRGGEAAKNGWEVFDVVAGAIDAARICRHSFVLAIGGGAMLDAVGFAAATAHRGVRLARFPTTTLSQGDAGVGVKNAINAFGKKNFLGTFAPPWAVINDDRFLATLTGRDWRAGMSEAVKVALLKDARLFARIEAAAPGLARRDEASAAAILRRAAELHVQHIVRGGDPFEASNARPLDFGHWSAHKLEQTSGFRLRHGEAVAIGVALDTLVSAITGRLPEPEARRVVGCLARIGLPLYDSLLEDAAALRDGLEEFREHLGGRLTITLLEGIGRPVDVHAIDPAAIAEGVRRLAAIESGAARSA